MLFCSASWSGLEERPWFGGSFFVRETPVALPSRADRNLLFGILALQMDFITRDGLVGAMQAWVFAKEKPWANSWSSGAACRRAAKTCWKPWSKSISKPIAATCRRASLPRIRPISAASRTFALSATQSWRRAWPQPPGKQGQNPESTGPFVARAGMTMLALRYQPLRLHAKGGLGEVFVALDQELHREVALKEIKERYAHDAGSRSRFVLEAEITGGLEHPGIVPVYGLGSYADGRPFYAMRFVRGQTLKEAIQRFPCGGQAGP